MSTTPPVCSSTTALHSTLRRSLFGIVALGAGSVASAQVYDVATDFAASPNTSSSTWSFRYDEDLVQDSSYDLLDTFVVGGPGWSPTAPDTWTLGGGLPVAYRNQTAGVLTFIAGAPVTMQPGQFAVHPGQSQLVVVSWLSPVSSFYQVSYDFTDLDPNSGDGIDWAVELSTNVTNLASGSFVNGGSSGSLSLAPLFIPAGERINFIVAPKGDYLFDSTSMNATITTVIPEPATVGLVLGLGAAGVCLLRRRRS